MLDIARQTVYGGIMAWGSCQVLRKGVIKMEQCPVCKGTGYDPDFDYCLGCGGMGIRPELDREETEVGKLLKGKG